MLTDTTIRRLKPSDKCTPNRPDKHSDGNGLQLWVRHTGAKKWVMAYRYHGKQTNIILGDYPAISLQQARLQALETKEKLKQGIDPKTAKPNTVLFGDMAGEYHTQRDPQHPNNKGKYTVVIGTHKRDLSQYTHDIAPYIAHLDINAITPTMILDIAKRIEKRGAYDMAKRAIRQIGAIFRHARDKGHYDRMPPTDGLEKRLSKHKSEHFARLEFHELPRFFAHVEHSTCKPLTKLAFKFICLTFVRTIEMRFMTWAEIDWDNALWRIGADKMKMRKPHIVPLAPQALAILRQIQAMGLSDTWVFYNTKTKRPMSENFLTQALKRLGYQGRMTGHGFRGIASTKLHELQYNHECIELQLAHSKADKVSQAYNGAMYLDYRILMMNEWANLIEHNTHQK
ncbi:MAG: tyrosine-type recombinase/integrase [Moraxella sp.]|nr:tyrosine-type recombinase/integrase [Moraxella sp.]